MFKQATQRRVRNSDSLPVSTSSILRSIADRDGAPLFAQPAARAAQASREYAEQHGHHFGQYAIFSQREQGENATTTLQRIANSQAAAKEPSSEEIHSIAQQGIRTPVSSFPYAARIQQSFGHHNISRIKAHLGKEATESAQAIHAAAYTIGEHVVFAGKPDLHTAVHEATHVLHQHSGARLANGVGQEGDEYEQHADAVADQVAAGQSAEELLDETEKEQHGTQENISVAGHIVQSRRLVQRVRGPRGRTRPAPRPRTLPAFTARRVSGEDEASACGGFKRVIEWDVMRPRKGLIIQKVTRRFEVRKVGVRGNMTGTEINAYITNPRSDAYATETKYWELWRVNAGGVVSDGGDDTFSLCSIVPRSRGFRNTTEGRFTITGEAGFYPTSATPSSLGFRRRSVGAAGGLFSRRSDPSRLPRQAGPTLRHRVTVTWNSTYPGPKYQPESQVRETFRRS
jgi:hypothetical protein